jgi:hypothetical protein
MPLNAALINNSSREETVISIDRHREKKASPKYNKPHCIIPLEDMQWVINQAKSIQILWNECWASDQYGSRWMKLSTSLSEKAFRIARKILYSTGLFEFKRETCTDDCRKTAGWLVINLHGARRIKEYWLSEDEQIDGQNLPSNSPEQSTVNNQPNNSQPVPNNSQNKPNDGQKIPPILSETPVKSIVSETLSNISETSQELLKGVSEKKVNADSELFERVRTRLGEKLANKLKGVLDRCASRASGELKTENYYKEKFLHQYNWRIDEQRFTQLTSLNLECQQEFFNRFKCVWESDGMSAPRTFDKVFVSVKSNSSKITEAISRQMDHFNRVWEEGRDELTRITLTVIATEAT